MTEKWVPAPGFDGYDASDQGRVRSWRSRWGKRSAPLVLSPATDKGGYQQVALHNGSGQRTTDVHALVLLAFVGPKPDGMVRRHLDGDPANNRLSNLAYGTYSQNNLDAVSHGTHAMAARTHCPSGHPYDETNTAYTPAGRRRCFACRRAYNKRAAERRRAARSIA